jgi:hypothetical protein
MAGGERRWYVRDSASRGYLGVNIVLLDWSKAKMLRGIKLGIATALQRY